MAHRKNNNILITKSLVSDLTKNNINWNDLLTYVAETVVDLSNNA